MTETWHQLHAEAVADRLTTDLASGLTPDAAARRLTETGPNELVDRQQRSAAAILWSQLTGTMVVVLVAAAGVSAVVGDVKDALVIGAIVLFNTLLGFRQEFRAERAMIGLRQLASPRARVRRDSSVQEVAARDLVPGDLVLLEAGNVVPADGRVVDAVNLRTQEAALTGESNSVTKQTAPIDARDLPVADRRNMVLMGTTVVHGRGSAVVTATGMHTELGAIAETLQAVQHEPTPLQRRLDALGRVLAVAAVAIVAVIFAFGVARGEPLRLMFLTAVSLAVAAVPEGLPAVVTIALALGAHRMLARRALIRKLPAVETLGSVTVICSDKTGTLTENRMRATVAHVDGRRVLLEETAAPDVAASLLLTAGALCNDATLRTATNAGPDGGELIGDPTEAALVRAAARFNLRKDDLERRFPRVAEVPFDSERKRMTTVHTLPGAWLSLERAFHQAWREEGGRGEPLHVAFTKGAVDPLLDICSRRWTRDGTIPLDQTERARIEAAHDRIAAEGVRVLGIAFRPLRHAPEVLENVERDLVFLGLVGLVDPPRAEVGDAVATCAHAGIRPVMITGDHPLTARYIARAVGLSAGDRIVTGAELSELSPADLTTLVGDVRVYARVSPQHKYRIVEALQSRGEIVAMTGDGVNDAPALKKADIGIAMGVSGTDVAKEAADAVLVDDNFATIVSAIEEGRVIYDNIRKFVKYLLTTNSGELWLMFTAPLVGMPLPLAPLQILWINLVTDGPTALALGLEPAERHVMRRPPRAPRESIFAHGLGRHVLWVGALMGGLTLGAGYWYWAAGDPRWQTVVFSSLAFTQMAHVLAIRSSRESLFTIGLLSNPRLAAAVALTIALQVALVHTPALQGIFSTVALTLQDYALCIAIALAIFAAVECEKWVMRRRARSGSGGLRAGAGGESFNRPSKSPKSRAVDSRTGA